MVLFLSERVKTCEMHHHQYTRTDATNLAFLGCCVGVLTDSMVLLVCLTWTTVDLLIIPVSGFYFNLRQDSPLWLNQWNEIFLARPLSIISSQPALNLHFAFHSPSHWFWFWKWDYLVLHLFSSLSLVFACYFLWFRRFSFYDKMNLICSFQIMIFRCYRLFSR